MDTTGDGAEGLWYVMGNDYDVIILDLMLPSMDGLKILKKLRAKGRKNPVLSPDSQRHLRRPRNWFGPRRRRLPSQAICIQGTAGTHTRTNASKVPGEKVLYQGQRFADRLSDTAGLARSGGSPAYATGIRARGIPGHASGPDGIPHRYMGARLRVQFVRFQQRGGCLYWLSTQKNRT